MMPVRSLAEAQALDAGKLNTAVLSGVCGHQAWDGVCFPDGAARVH